MHILCAVPQRWLSAFSELNKNYEIENNLVTCDEDLPALMHAEPTPQLTHGCLWRVMLPFLQPRHTYTCHSQLCMAHLWTTQSHNQLRLGLFNLKLKLHIFEFDSPDENVALFLSRPMSVQLFSRIDSKCKPGLGRVGAGVSCKSCVSVSPCVCVCGCVCLFACRHVMVNVGAKLRIEIHELSKAPGDLWCAVPEPPPATFRPPAPVM